MNLTNSDLAGCPPPDPDEELNDSRLIAKLAGRVAEQDRTITQMLEAIRELIQAGTRTADCIEALDRRLVEVNAHAESMFTDLDDSIKEQADTIAALAEHSIILAGRG